MSKNDLIEDLFPLTPLQQGLLFHALYEPGSGAYVGQFGFELTGELDVDAFRRAWEAAVERHAALRTGFAWEGGPEPLQVVRRRVEVGLAVEDWRALPAAERAARLEAYLQSDRARGFDPARAPLMRLALFRTGDQAHELVWTHHHLLVDGWSVGLVFRDVVALYDAFSEGRPPALPAVRPYRGYAAWLKRQDAARAEAFWRRELAGFTAPTPVPAARPAPAAAGHQRLETQGEGAGTPAPPALAPRAPPPPQP